MFLKSFNVNYIITKRNKEAFATNTKIVGVCPKVNGVFCSVCK
jgi:hypothetical protein